MQDTDHTPVKEALEDYDSGPVLNQVPTIANLLIFVGVSLEVASVFVLDLTPAGKLPMFIELTNHIII